jgi:hypothetical protein
VETQGQRLHCFSRRRALNFTIFSIYRTSSHIKSIFSLNLSSLSSRPPPARPTTIFRYSFISYPRSGNSFLTMPLLTEYNLNEVCKYDTPLALQAPKFCLDAAAIPRLSDGRVVTVDRRREPTRPWHEYLILCVVDINGSPDIWIRYERGRNLEDIPWTWKAISIAPALDSVRISCDCNKLRKSGNETIAFLQCGSGLRLRHTFELLSIIEQESRNWSIIGQNCWWYCAVNMDLYQKKFGGNWILEPKPPKKDVRKMIHSVLGDVVEVTTRVSKRYLGDANPASREIDVQRFLRLSMGKSPSTYVGNSINCACTLFSPLYTFAFLIKVDSHKIARVCISVTNVSI